MALIEKTGGANYKKATALAVGEAYEGYFIGYSDSQYTNTDGEPHSNIRMQSTAGELYTIYSAGNLQYAKKDGRLEVGQYTVITRLTDKPPAKKGSKPQTSFKIQQDPEVVIGDADELTASGITSDVTPIKVSNVAAKVNALAKQAGSR